MHPKKPRIQIRKIIQITLVILIYFLPILYFHFFYIIRYAKHPEKYPIEKRYKVARKEIRGAVKLLRVRYDVENFSYLINQKEKFAIISNHQGAIDPLFLIAISEKPISFVAKIEVKKYPFIGKIILALDGVFLDRDHIFNQLESIKQITHNIKDERKANFTIFIEGHRNKHIEGDVLEYKGGTIKTIAMSKVKIINLAMYGSYRVLSGRTYLHVYPIHFHFFNPIEYEDYKNLNTIEVATKLENMANIQIDKFREIDKTYINKMKISKGDKYRALLMDYKTKFED